MALSHCWLLNGSLKPNVLGQIGVRKQENLKSATFCANYCSVIHTSSNLDVFFRVVFSFPWSDVTMADSWYNGAHVYGVTKLSNVWFTTELARRLKGFSNAMIIIKLLIK